MQQLIYKGLIVEGSKGENEEALFIGEIKEPIAYELKEKIQGKEVSIRYWISNIEKTKEKLTTNMIKTMVGAIDADYEDRYSENTGYLWTDEDINVGGHDLLSELRSSIGKFNYMEIDVHG